MMAANWCHRCNVNWPPYNAMYALCPVCKAATYHDKDMVSLTNAAAHDTAVSMRQELERREQNEAKMDEAVVQKFNAGLDDWLAAQLC